MGRKELQIDDAEAPIRKLMYELFLECRKKGAVAAQLNAKGYRTRGGANFSDTTVTRLLKDSSAKGVRLANYTTSTGINKAWELKPESEWIRVPCPAVVSAEMWDECNRILRQQDENRNKRESRTAVHLFSGILACGCGGKMYVYTDITKYKCSKCRKTKIGTDDMEDIYHSQLKVFLLSDGSIEKFMANATFAIDEKEKQLAVLQATKKRLEGEMDKTMQLYQDGIVTKEDFAKYYNPNSVQLRQVENAIPETMAEIDFLRMEYLNGDTVIQEAQKLQDKWHNYDLLQKRQLVEQITERITVTGDEIRIKFNYNPTPFQNPEKTQRNRDGSLTLTSRNFA